MILRQLNEFVRESVVLALEPARRCVGGCTYCFASLNSRSQYANRSKSEQDDGSFERTLEKANGPAYDPTDFLQWGLRNRLVLGWANTVEPFQDVKQARSCLQVCNNFNIPLFIQTKGVNFREVSDLLGPVIPNSSFFVSLPSLDERVRKRFEPGTPELSERLGIINWLADREAWVIAALSPYHEDFVSNPADLVGTLADAGASEIFLDRLHLNGRQRDACSDPVVISLAGGPRKSPPAKYIDHLKIIHEAAIDNGLDIYINGFDGLSYGRPSTLPTISPDECFPRGMPWPYHDGSVFQYIQDAFYVERPDGSQVTPVDRRPSDSIVVTWDDCLRLMEASGSTDQEFSYRSLYDIVPIGRKLSDAWTATIRPVATMSQIFRALWNTPYENAFFWRHPWIAVAEGPDGTPYLDDDGNLIALFDPDILDRRKKMFRAVESLDEFRRLGIEIPGEDE